MDNIDLVWSHLEEKKVSDRLRIEKLNKEVSLEQAIVDDREIIFESRRRYFENQYSNKSELLQALLGAAVPGKYRSMNKEPLLQFAVRSGFVIPGIDLLPTLRGLKYFDEEGNQKAHMFSDQKRRRKGYDELHACDESDEEISHNISQDNQDEDRDKQATEKGTQGFFPHLTLHKVVVSTELNNFLIFFKRL